MDHCTSKCGITKESYYKSLFIFYPFVSENSAVGYYRITKYGSIYKQKNAFGQEPKIVRLDVPMFADPRWEEVTLQCEYDLGGKDLYSVKWFKDGIEFFRFMPSSEPVSEYFHVEGIVVDIAQSNGRQVKLLGQSNNRREKINLTGSYGCEVSSEAPSFRMTYAEANMSVAVLPTKPPVLDGFRPYYKIGEVLEAACTSALSYPRAVLTFILNGKERNRLTPQKIFDRLKAVEMSETSRRYFEENSQIHKIIHHNCLWRIAKVSKSNVICAQSQFPLHPSNGILYYCTSICSRNNVDRAITTDLPATGHNEEILISVSQLSFSLRLERQHFPGGTLHLVCQSSLPDIPNVRAFKTEKTATLAASNERLAQEAPKSASSSILVPSFTMLLCFLRISWN
ncbi:hypothetical protein HZH68_003451 [Vespula germanica]|uniref:Ig-like domain-containing protein n=1 Tax=Vespula germanica TaxID=30212 RepID=A0A834NP81_VESGE|nr:hypothetical protein HZH68_003451 [Vespula germanica]